MKNRYYYITDDQEFGPFDFKCLKELNLPPDTPIRRESSSTVTPISQLIPDSPDVDACCVKIEQNPSFHLFSKKKNK